MKAAKVKNTKQKGVVYCWNENQDPKEYMGIRVSNERSDDEICQQEIANAIRYVLKEKGALDKDELIKETSLLFGYKRLGKNLEANLMIGLQYAKTSGFISANVSGKYIRLILLYIREIKKLISSTLVSQKMVKMIDIVRMNLSSIRKQ